MNATHPEKIQRSLFNAREYDNGTHKRHFPSWMNFSWQTTSCINQISAQTSSQDHCSSSVAVFKCLVQTLFTSWLETSESVTKNIWRIQYTIWCVPADCLIYMCCKILISHHHLNITNNVTSRTYMQKLYGQGAISMDRWSQFMTEEGRVTMERNDQTLFHFTWFPAELSNVLYLQCYNYIYKY